MLAHKEKPEDKPIKVTTNTKPKANAKTSVKNKIIGITLIVLALISLLIPADNGQPDGTAFVMLLFIGITALFAK